MSPIDFTQKAVKKIFRSILLTFNIEPSTGTKIHPRADLKKIGTSYGGWVIPESLLNDKSICYCVGCGEDISFDLGLIEHFGCDVFGFDPTPRAIAHAKRVAGENPKYHFFDFGLWKEETILRFFAPKNSKHVSHSIVNLQRTDDFIEAKVKRISQAMMELSHRSIDLLKIDIEGAEYDVIDTIFADDVDVRVLCVEFDECYHPIDRAYRSRIGRTVNLLRSRGYRLVYAKREGNFTFIREDERL